MKPWRSRRGFWIALGFVLWCVLLSEVPASEREHPLLQLAIVLWPLLLVWRLLCGLPGEFLSSLASRLPFVVAGGVGVWGLHHLARDWYPETREDFGVLTPGPLAREALFSYPMTGVLLLSLGAWQVHRLLRSRQDASVFGTRRCLLLLWAGETLRNLLHWQWANHGIHLGFLWVGISAGLLALFVCFLSVAVFDGLAEPPIGRRLQSFRVGNGAAVCSVLMLCAGLVLLTERITFDRLWTEIEESRRAASVCSESKRPLAEDGACTNEG